MSSKQSWQFSTVTMFAIVSCMCMFLSGWTASDLHRTQQVKLGAAAAPTAQIAEGTRLRLLVFAVCCFIGGWAAKGLVAVWMARRVRVSMERLQRQRTKQTLSHMADIVNELAISNRR